MTEAMPEAPNRDCFDISSQLVVGHRTNKPAAYVYLACYRMVSKPHGLALVFGNEWFSQNS